MKKGFTLIELLVSLVVIGILGTMGYQGYTKITMDTKAQAVATELKSINKAISENLANTGGYFQNNEAIGSDPMGPTPNEITNLIGFESDYENADEGSLAQKIERGLHDQLKDMGLVYKKGAFRLKSIPLAKVSFPTEANGVRAFRIEGIPGNIALKMLSKVNDTPNPTPTDGSTPARPLVIAKAGEQAAPAGTTALEGIDSIIGGSDKRYIQNTDNLDNDINTIKQSPKVIIYYVYEISEAWN
jgi:prepilin-type N-terminal cleavage/methylation domain-containing protein